MPAPAFSLIELLVVIAIIALLVSILLPAIKKARDAAYTVREMAACQQLLVAYHTYTTDNKDRVLPPVAEYWQVWHNDLYRLAPMPVYSDAADRLYYLSGQPYAWRLAPYLNYEFQLLVTDKERLAEIRALKRAPLLGDFKTFERALAWNTSFGMSNDGIDYFSKANCSGNIESNINLTEHVTIRHAADVVLADQYLLFATSRAYEREFDPHMQPVTGSLINGSHQVVAPFKDGRPARYCASSSSAWNPRRPPNDFGYLDLRHNSRAIVGSFDEHTILAKLDQLRSMKRWSNTPTDWNLVTK